MERPAQPAARSARDRVGDASLFGGHVRIGQGRKTRRHAPFSMAWAVIGWCDLTPTQPRDPTHMGSTGPRERVFWARQEIFPAIALRYCDKLVKRSAATE